MHSTAKTFLFAVAGAAATVVAGSASAQQSIPPVRVTASATDRANDAHMRAEELQGSIRNFRKAARLHRQSAGLRGAEDPQAFTCLYMAAALQYHAGDRLGARETMIRAADQAAARGAVVDAANADIDVAILSQELREPDQAWEFGRRARILASSPMLSDAQRQALRSRIDGPAELALLHLP